MTGVTADATARTHGEAFHSSDADPPRGKDRRKDRLLRLKAVIARTGLSTATIYRRETDGLFPKRQRIGPRCVAWYESDIDDFICDPFNYRSG